MTIKNSFPLQSKHGKDVYNENFGLGHEIITFGE